MNKKDFIKQNMDLIPDSLLSKAYSDIIESKFKKEIGFSLEVLNVHSRPYNTDSKYGIPRIEFYSNSEIYESIIEDFKKFSDNKEKQIALKVKYAFNVLKHTQIISEGVIQLHGSLHSVINLISYCLKKGFPKDDILSDQILTDSGLKSPYVFSNVQLLGVMENNKIYITKYKNNKMIIKGLSSKEWRIFEVIIDLVNNIIDKLIFKSS